MAYKVKMRNKNPKKISPSETINHAYIDYLLYIQQYTMSASAVKNSIIEENYIFKQLSFVMDLHWIVNLEDPWNSRTIGGGQA